MSLVTRRDQSGSEISVSNLHKRQGRTYKENAKDIPIEKNTQELIKIVASSKKLSISKEDACFHLWALAACDKRQRDEMLDLFLPGMLLRLIHSPTSSDAARFNAVGCLQILSTMDDGCEQIVDTKVAQRTKNGVRVIAELLLGNHDRSKVAAASCLYELSSQYKRQPEVLNVLPLMLRVLDVEDPDWAGIKDAHAYVATAIRNLVLFSEEHKKENVKKQLLALGAIPALVALMKRGPKEASTAALGTLRELTSVKGTLDAMVQCQGVEKLATVLNHGMDEQKALASGCIMELTAIDEGKERMVSEGILIPLVKVLAWGLQCLKHTKNVLKGAKAAAKKKKKKAKSKGGHPLKRDPALPPAVDMAVCNATGALLNLSFRDDVKVAIRECGALPLLVSFLHSHNLVTQEHVTGTIWNMALEPSNTQFMLASNVPGHLVSPLHHSWLTPAEQPHTVYAGAMGIATSKPYSAPAKAKQHGNFSHLPTDKPPEFTRKGSRSIHPPRTPEEDKVRANTPPKVNLFGRPVRRASQPNVTNVKQDGSPDSKRDGSPGKRDGSPEKREGSPEKRAASPAKGFAGLFAT